MAIQKTSNKVYYTMTAKGLGLKTDESNKFAVKVTNTKGVDNFYEIFSGISGIVKKLFITEKKDVNDVLQKYVVLELENEDGIIECIDMQLGNSISRGLILRLEKIDFSKPIEFHCFVNKEDRRISYVVQDGKKITNDYSKGGIKEDQLPNIKEVMVGKNKVLDTTDRDMALETMLLNYEVK